MTASLVVRTLRTRNNSKYYSIAHLYTGSLHKSDEFNNGTRVYAPIRPVIGDLRVLSRSLSIFSHNINKSMRGDGIPRQQSRHFSMQSFADTQMSIYRSISESSIVGGCQEFLIGFHDTTGLPWWGSIILSTILVRTVITVPLAIYQNYIIAKVENISHEMSEIAKELHMETVVAKKMFNWTDKQATLMFRRSLKKQYNLLIVRDNCHPFKASILLWFQIPLWVSLSFALRNIVYMRPNFDIAAQLRFTELTVGGFGWIPNLTELDHSLIFPLSLGLLNLAIVEMQTMTKLKARTKFQTYLTNFFRVFSIAMIPISAMVPSCMCLYWTTSSAFGLTQNLILLSPKLRRKCGIPISPSELENPYRHIQSEIKRRLSFLQMFKIKPN